MRTTLYYRLPEDVERLKAAVTTETIEIVSVEPSEEIPGMFDVTFEHEHAHHLFYLGQRYERGAL